MRNGIIRDILKMWKININRPTYLVLMIDIYERELKIIKEVYQLKTRSDISKWLKNLDFEKHIWDRYIICKTNVYTRHLNNWRNHITKSIFFNIMGIIQLKYYYNKKELNSILKKYMISEI